jgi:UDP-glucuronate 4-epimerase
MKILVTGGAGFIGSALTRALIDTGHQVTVIDNFNDYYDVSLKHDRVAALIPEVDIKKVDVTDRTALNELFSETQFDVVCHLAAMAGVRYSVEHPQAYVDNNVTGLITLLECMRQHGVQRMVFASSSSVYGNDSSSPFLETAVAAAPESVYGATKRAGELILHSYFKQYGIQTTALRFFTVYGPWSRPDMAMLKFAKLMQSGQEIDVYNQGELRRDFTYIDDIVAGFVAAVHKPLGYEIVNLGRGEPFTLMDYISSLEAALGVEAKKNLLPMQQGDVFETYADITKARELLGFSPQTSIKEGISHFANWFKEYYKDPVS